MFGHDRHDDSMSQPRRERKRKIRTAIPALRAFSQVRLPYCRRARSDRSGANAG
jgi:hypothetical protein